MTTTTLDAFLASRDADTDTVQQAMRGYVLRRTDFLSLDEMRRELVAAAGSEEAVGEALTALERDSALLESAALAVLSDAWERPSDAERVRRAVDDAKTKMPVIEVGLLAIVAMYGMYLATTGGVKESEWIVRRGEAGKFERVRRTTYYGPSGPLAVIGNVLAGIREGANPADTAG